MKNTPLLYSACFLAALTLSSPAGTIHAAEGCVSADCHPGLGKDKYVHDPVAGGECDACHVEEGSSHPGEGSTMELTEQGSRLCLQCHDDPGDGKKIQHPPVQDDCTNCHSPHQGDRPRFLVEPLGELCIMCHDQIGSIIEESASRHDPVADGECLNCHAQHGSDHAPMLVMFYPRDIYTPYSDDKFALCFQCHEKTSFTMPITEEVTNFRNGSRNLHFVHVNNDKGRVCINCHGVHGGDQQKLIHSTPPAFGVWNIPLEITMTETGATCFQGCHKKRAYDRVQRVDNF